MFGCIIATVRKIEKPTRALKWKGRTHFRSASRAASAFAVAKSAQDFSG
jgi:hypothetical protein